MPERETERLGERERERGEIQRIRSYHTYFEQEKMECQNGKAMAPKHKAEPPDIQSAAFPTF